MKLVKSLFLALFVPLAMLGCEPKELATLTSDQLNQVKRVNSDMAEISSLARESAGEKRGGVAIPNGDRELSKWEIFLRRDKVLKAMEVNCRRNSAIPAGSERELKNATRRLVVNHKSRSKDCPLTFIEEIVFDVGARSLRGARGVIRSISDYSVVNNQSSFPSEIFWGNEEHELEVEVVNGTSQVVGWGSGELSTNTYGRVKKSFSVKINGVRGRGTDLEQVISYSFKEFTASGLMKIQFDRRGKIVSTKFTVNGKDFGEEEFFRAFSLATPLTIPKEFIVLN